MRYRTNEGHQIIALAPHKTNEGLQVVLGVAGSGTVACWLVTEAGRTVSGSYGLAPALGEWTERTASGPTAGMLREAIKADEADQANLGVAR